MLSAWQLKVKIAHCISEQVYNISTDSVPLYVYIYLGAPLVFT